MRTAAKLLSTGLAMLLLAVFIAAIAIASVPVSNTDWPMQAFRLGMFTGPSFPLLAVAILPWLAVPDTAPQGKKFYISTPLFLLISVFKLGLVSLALLIGPLNILLLVAMAQDSIATKNWFVAAILVVGLPSGIATFLYVPWLLISQLIAAWRWRHWPLLVVTNDGLHVPGLHPVPWAVLKGATAAIERGRFFSRLLISGPRSTQTWFGSQAVTQVDIDLSTLAGPTAAVVDAIAGHPSSPLA